MIVRVNVNDNIRFITTDTVINAINGAIITLQVEPREIFHLSGIKQPDDFQIPPEFRQA